MFLQVSKWAQGRRPSPGAEFGLANAVSAAPFLITCFHYRCASLNAFPMNVLNGVNESAMSQQGELQGFINVKIPSRMKSRSFIPWKTWKRQWVVVRRSRSTRNGVELLIGRNSPTILQISPEDVICRTESRTQHYAFGVFSHQNKRRANVYLSGTSETDSQKWISKIRKLLKPPLLPVEENEFSVSVIDNFFSRSAGLSGLYGTLRICPESVAIVDPSTSKNKVEWPWMSLSQFHVSSTIGPEDKGHVCTVVTSRTFHAGIGQIHLFCLESVALAGKLRGRGRAASLLSSAEGRLTTPHRHHTFSCNSPEKQSRGAAAPPSLSASQAALESNSKPFLFGRRLSRSEGNLLSALREVDSGLYGFLEDKTSIDSSEYFFGKGKVGPGILSAGLGLFLPTPGGSEGDNESLQEVQRLPNGDSDDELTALSPSVPLSKFSPPRRESGVSIASGVYEEIDEFSIDFSFSSLDLTNESESPPPPLPPRREPSNRTMSDGDGYENVRLAPPALERFLSRSAGNTPLPSPPCPPKSHTSAEAIPSWTTSEDSDYLPMLPGCGFFRAAPKTDFASKESLEDPHYMVMSSIKGT